MARRNNTRPKPNNNGNGNGSKPNKPNNQQEKQGIKQELRQKIEEALYKLNQDVIINRMSTRDELFGDNRDLEQLTRSMKKHEKKESKIPGKKNQKEQVEKVDIKLELLEREK